MKTSNLKRRDFHKLTMAAFGGLVAGTGARSVSAQEEEKKERLVDPYLLAQEPNVCKGLNTCRGKGKGDPAGAGQASCATVGRHDCAGENECKGQGGCGVYPGQNTCKAKGECAVPLKPEVWTLARKQFEYIMKGLGKQVGPAPQ